MIYTEIENNLPHVEVSLDGLKYFLEEIYPIVKIAKAIKEAIIDKQLDNKDEEALELIAGTIFSQYDNDFNRISYSTVSNLANLIYDHHSYGKTEDKEVTHSGWCALIEEQKEEEETKKRSLF
jgi:hypothetical protein